MATTFIESGSAATRDFKFWTAVIASGGSAFSSDSQAVSGAVRSIKYTDNGFGFSHFGYAHADGILADAGRRITQYRRFTNIPSVTVSIIEINQSGGNPCFAIGLDSSGRLAIYDSNFVVQATGSSVIAINTDRRISVTYTITSASVNSISVYLDGILEVSATNITVRINSNALYIGWNIEGATTTANGDCYIAHVYVDDGSSGDPGDIHVTSKRPNANGTTNGFATQIGAGGSGYGTGHSPQVNERPLSNTNGWSMVGAGSAVTEEYSVEGASVGDNDISGGTIIDYAGWIDAKALVSETGQIVVGGVNTNVALTSTETLFTQIAGSTVYPAGGTDIGLITATTLTTVSLYECGLIFAYIPGAAAVTQTEFGIRNARFSGRFVGPPAIRRNTPQPIPPQDNQAPPSDTNFIFPARPPNKIVGPMILRARWRQPPYPQDQQAIAINFEFVFPVRTPNRFVGPSPFRIAWRSQHIPPWHFLAPLTNTEFGSPTIFLPNSRVGPPTLRRSIRRIWLNLPNNFIVTSGAAPYESVATLRPTGVTNWESLFRSLATRAPVYESLLGLKPSGVVNLESLFALHPTRSAPWESVLRLISTRLAPWESLLQIRPTRIGVYESLLGVKPTSVMRIETLGDLHITGSAPYESLLRLLSPRVMPLENLLGRVQGLKIEPYESLQRSRATGSGGIESLLALHISSLVPWESLLRRQASAGFNEEDLQSVHRQNVVPFESLLAAHILAGGTVESLFAAHSLSLTRLESLLRIAPLTSIRIESLARLTGASTAAMETLLHLANSRLVNWESSGVQIVASLAAMPYESLQRLSVSGRVPYEALGELVHLAILANILFESLTRKTASIASPTENLGRPASSATMPLESFRRSLATAIANLESLIPLQRSAASPPIESASGARATAIMRVESLKRIAITARIILEELERSHITSVETYEALRAVPPARAIVVVEALHRLVGEMQALWESAFGESELTGVEDLIFRLLHILHPDPFEATGGSQTLVLNAIQEFKTFVFEASGGIESWTIRSIRRPGAVDFD